jgi:lipoprotein-releasing system permease protein
MRLSLYIAKRYLFAKKSRNAINVISTVSVAGVSVGTMALIIILSVFNGLELLVKTIFNTFDPDLKVTSVAGKVFAADTSKLKLLSEINGVSCYALTIEENALLKYDEKQFIATIKGVDDNYTRVSSIDSALWDGKFSLKSDNGRSWAVPGIGIAQYLGIRLNFVNPILIYVPRRSADSDSDPDKAFNRDYIYPSGIFQVEQSYDSKYLFLPIEFARRLIEREGMSGAVEIRLKKGTDADAVQKQVGKLFGSDFTVKNRFQQQELFFKVMQSERLAIFFILTLILVIASFNIIGSLTMLIIEKERDIEILKSLGADNNLIRKIFILEGWMISIIGAVAGLVLGYIVCWLQQKYGFIKLNSESLIMNSYPVVIKLKDFIIVPATVLTIGYWAAWYPVRYLTRKYLKKDEK